MTVLDFDRQLAPVRTGGFADLATALAWLVGLLVTLVDPGGLVVAGVALGVTATSIARAFAAGASFGIVVAAAGWLWIHLDGTVPLPVDLPIALVVLTTLLVPPTVASVVRTVG